MSEIAEIIDTLEGRLKKLLQKIETLEQTTGSLQQELNKAATVIQNQSSTIEGLTTRYDTLKITNSLLGSDENKRETKLKINALIREIDYCIAQLAD